MGLRRLICASLLTVISTAAIAGKTYSDNSASYSKQHSTKFTACLARKSVSLISGNRFQNTMLPIPNAEN